MVADDLRGRTSCLPLNLLTGMVVMCCTIVRRNIVLLLALLLVSLKLTKVLKRPKAVRMSALVLLGVHLSLINIIN